MALFGKKEPWRPHRIEEEDAQPKRLFQKKRNPKHFLTCKPADVIDFFHESVEIDSPLTTLEILYQGWVHRVGISSEIDKEGPHDIEFFLDDQSFDSMEAFLEGAMLHGNRFAELTDNITILQDVLFGDPHNYTLFEAREIHESHNF